MVGRLPVPKMQIPPSLPPQGFTAFVRHMDVYHNMVKTLESISISRYLLLDNLLSW